MEDYHGNNLKNGDYLWKEFQGKPIFCMLFVYLNIIHQYIIRPCNFREDIGNGIAGQIEVSLEDLKDWVKVEDPHRGKPKINIITNGLSIIDIKITCSR